MDLNELSFDKLGSWPIRVRIIILASALIFTLTLGYLFLIRPRLTNINNLEKQWIDLRSRYQSEHKQETTLPEYEKQLSNIKRNIASSSKQFTTPNEIPQLISTISNLAAANNLEINSIKPEPESAQDFYKIMPISISVVADYHHLALFISQVESLQKIIIFNDFTMATLNDKKRDDSGAAIVNMSATITIYILNVPEYKKKF